VFLQTRANPTTRAMGNRTCSPESKFQVVLEVLQLIPTGEAL